MSTLPIASIAEPAELTGAAPGMSVNAEAAEGRTQGEGRVPFSEFLEQDLGAEAAVQKNEKEGTVSTGETPWAVGMPVPAWMLENPEMNTILDLLLETPTPTLNAGEAQAAAGAGDNAVLAGASAPVEGVWIPGFILPGSSDGDGRQKGSEKMAGLGTVSEKTEIDGASAEGATPVPDSSGGKLKLDFSMFDAAFPEGWQELVFEKPVADMSAALAISDSGKNSETRKTGSETSSTHTGIDTAPAGSSTSGTLLEGMELDVLRGRFSQSQDPERGSERSVLGQAKSESLKAVSTSEKAIDPLLGRVDVRVESVVLPSVGSEEKGLSSQSTSPASVLSRLTDLQQKMTVEAMVQTALPVFQGKRESITIDLNPPELGRVQVRVENNGVGVNAVLTVQDRGLGEFFQGQSDLIRKNLEEAGIRVGQLSVEVRQQMHREAGERPPVAAGKQGRSAATSGLAGASRVESTPGGARWNRQALSQVDMMV